MQKVPAPIKKSLELIQADKLDDAVSLLKNLINKNYRDINALNILGQIYIKQRKIPEAIEYLEKSFKLNQKDTGTLCLLGDAYQLNRNYDKALDLYHQSLRINPKQGLIYYSIGTIHTLQNKQIESISFFLKALDYCPNDVRIHNNLARSASGMGLYEIALKHYQIAAQLDPSFKEPLNCIIFNAHKDPNLDLKDFQFFTKLYYERFLGKIKDTVDIDYKNKLDINKKHFKIGFVSGDFFTHPVAAYFIKVLEHINQDDFEIFLYHTSKFNDITTEKIKSLAPHFTNITDLSHQAAAELIKSDDIDILCDLSGFTNNHRLEIFKIKPAPLQFSHIGYFGSLGIPEMDFFLADENVVKEGEEDFFTERVYKMQGSYAHCHLAGIPESSPELPYNRNGYITFGSMNGFHKVSREVLRTWAQVLNKVENSKLLIEAQVLDSKSNQDYVLNILKDAGISEERIIIRYTNGRQDFLKSYNDIDINLDSFPYGGGTTALESLLMGVPIVTIDGDRWVSRLASTTLKTIRHEELIASNKEEYIEKIITLSTDIKRLIEYRKNLRSDMYNSDLNIDKYIKNFEAAIKDMWKIKCLSSK